MKVLRVTVATGLLAVAGASLAPVLLAQGPPPMRGPDGPGFGRGGGSRGLLGGFARGFRELNVTDEQRQQIRSIVDSHREETQQIGERLRAAHVGLDALVTADAVDESAIRAKSAEVATVQADAAVLRARVHQEIQSVLTDEQKAKARELRAAADARMKERAATMKERRQQRQQGR